MRISPRVLLPASGLVALLATLSPVPASAQRMSEDALMRRRLVHRVVLRGIQAGGFSGAAIAMGTSDTVLLTQGFGRTSWSYGSPEVSASGTAFDLASLTKVVATTAAIMVLVDDRRIGIDDRVARHLPEFAGPGRDRITIRDLLMHRAGFPAGPALRGASSAASARRAVLRTPLAYTPRTREVYSDVGPMILGMLVERVARQPLDRFVERRIFSRIGMRATRFGPPAGRTIARTSDAGPIAVHDPNARRLGGVAGHAGLFSTVNDLARFARLILNGGSLDGVRIFRDSTVAMFTRRQADGRPLGWDACVGGGRCGLNMSDEAFGHTGFTGTSMWIDPERDVFVIVLTNSVFEPRAYDAHAVLSDVRADLADLATCAASAPGDELPRLRAEIAINWFHQGAAPLTLTGN